MEEIIRFKGHGVQSLGTHQGTKPNIIYITERPRSIFWTIIGVMITIGAVAFSGELLLEIHKWWGYINK